MGLFNRYREDVKRIGAALEPVLGGKLGEKEQDDVRYRLAGTRGGRSVRVALNEMHGIFEIACAVQGLQLGTVRIHGEGDIFAGDSPYIAPRLTMSTSWDANPLWELLPDDTRRTIVEMLQPSSSSMSLYERELSMMLGPGGLLRQPDAPDAILRELDRLLVVARAIETWWNIDPSHVGAGRSTHVPRPPKEPPPPLPVQTRGAAEIGARARPARDAMLERFAADLIPTFPVADALLARETVTGKVVLLPPRAPSEWANEVVAKAIAVGDAEYQWYFLRTDEPGFTRVMRAAARYERATDTQLGDAAYEAIARITGDPSMVIVNGQAQIGHQLAMLGVLIGARVFIDATESEGADSLFAGERD